MNINRAESAAIGLSFVGTIAAFITQQIVYVAAPLTLSLSLSRISRHRELSKANTQQQQLSSDIQSISDRARTTQTLINALPSAPTTVNFDELRTELGTTIESFQQEISRLEAAVFSNLKTKPQHPRLNLNAIDSSIKKIELRLSCLDRDLSIPNFSERISKIEGAIEKQAHELIETVTSAEIFESYIQTKIDKSITHQLELITKVFPNDYSYNLVQGRGESRQIFLEAIRTAETSLILVCPWLAYGIDDEAKELIKSALAKKVSIDIGWGHLGDVNNQRPLLSEENLLNSNKAQAWGGYSTFDWLNELQSAYPTLLTLRILGTHEKFLVCDRTFAMIGSHNFMSSGATSDERELGLKTDNPEIVNKLIKLFDLTKNDLPKNIGHPVLKARLN